MRVVIAGGGTGGHLFPGIAIAEEFLKRDQKTAVIFIGTRKGIESRLLAKLGYTLEEIDIEGIKGRGVKALMKGVCQIPKSMAQSRRIMKTFHPDIVVGVGGYASGPAVLVAHWMGVPTVIAEQNAVCGVTNKILGRFVDKIFVTYEQTKKFFPADKVVVSGNPVRSAVALPQEPRLDKKGYWQVLVFGGSQGAEAINGCLVEMMPLLETVKDKIRILHQTGARQKDEIARRYAEHGINAEVREFILEMAKAYQEADLIVCRAGATSLAEITAAGRAAVLIPYPFAADDHQLKNAQALAAQGAAVVIKESELNAEKLFDTIVRLLKDEGKRSQMEACSKKMGRPEAAVTIVNHCEALTERRKKAAA
jgi:UDP-N-acetylglucosamine--N-acetylmuramyl-(pentapeptide) pyrophosphoryl-undecaprenol N-acetylglucosamine transferase